MLLAILDFPCHPSAHQAQEALEAPWVPEALAGQVVPEVLGPLWVPPRGGRECPVSLAVLGAPEDP